MPPKKLKRLKNQNKPQETEAATVEPENQDENPNQDQPVVSQVADENNEPEIKTNDSGE